MAENKWIIDGHHYTCLECGNIMAIIENESDKDFDFCPFCGKRMIGQMANSKLEEIIDLLAVYGGFNREYLRDKLLTFANDRRSENKNKMAEIARMFGKKLGEKFTINFYNRLFDVAFDKHGLRVFSDEIFKDELSRLLLEGLIIGNAVIINED